MKINYLLDQTRNYELIICNHSRLSYPTHNHVSVYTIGLVLEGVIEISTPHIARTYKKGEIFVIPPYVPHGLGAIEEYSMISLCIHKREIESGTVQALQTKVFHLLDDVSALDEMQKEAILHKINELISNQKVGTKIFSDPIDCVREQLELFPEEKVSIEDMAQSVFISKYHFIRNFKREVGLTPHQFQIQNRVRKAQRLLRNTESITETALNAGFCDQSHFIKQFEKIVQLTPSGFVLSCRPLRCAGN